MMCARRVAADEKSSGRNVTMSGWIKIGAEFITALTHQWKGSSHPNLPSETTNSMAAEDLAPGVDSVAVRPESQTSIKPEASPNKQEIERRREIVRHFFNDFWMSTDDKPRTFAERLIGPKTISTNDWLRAERDGSLTPRLANSLAYRHLEPF